MVSVIDPETGKRVSRCYSLSGAPLEESYRITVKRVPGGKVSNLLHDSITEGDTLQIQSPRGRFHCNPEHQTEPLVLIAAGIGITPMLSMFLENLERSPNRPVHLFYQLRSHANAPFVPMLQRFIAANQSSLPCQLHVFFSKPDHASMTDDVSEGRVDAIKIRQVVGDPDGEYMICGPAKFMSSLADGLVESGVAPDHVHYESFGGDSKGGKSKSVCAVPADSDEEAASDHKVTFADPSNGPSHVLEWNSTSGTVLDLAEEHAVPIESACRSGSCGACLCKLRRGSVDYESTPEYELDDGEVLACVATPRSDLELELL